MENNIVNVYGYIRVSTEGQHNLLKMSEIQMIMVFLTEKVNVRTDL